MHSTQQQQGPAASMLRAAPQPRLRALQQASEDAPERLIWTAVALVGSMHRGDPNLRIVAHLDLTDLGAMERSRSVCREGCDGVLPLTSDTRYIRVRSRGAASAPPSPLQIYY